MDHRLTPSQNEIIQDALRSYPVSSMPRNLTADVLARIRITSAPRFQLTRNDYILTVVLTVLFSSLLWSLQYLPGQILLQMRMQGILLWQNLLVNARWFLPVVFFSLAACLAALTLPSLYEMAVKSKSR